MAYAFDIGSQIKAEAGFVLRLTSAAAGITTASTASLGEVIDRLSYPGNSVVNLVKVTAKIASTAASYITVGIRLEDADSSESTSFGEYTTEVQKYVGSTAAAAASTYQNVVVQNVDLSGAKRYIRQVVTIAPAATCSSGTTQAEGVLIFGGLPQMPSTY